MNDIITAASGIWMFIKELCRVLWHPWKTSCSPMAWHFPLERNPVLWHFQ